MTDRTRKEHFMKRMALIAGIAAALAVPAAASAGNSLQVKPQFRTQVVAQVQPQVTAQVVTQIATVQVHKAQIVETQRLRTKRFTLRTISR
jgi:hypothetical protein